MPPKNSKNSTRTLLRHHCTVWDELLLARCKFSNMEISIIFYYSHFCDVRITALKIGPKSNFWELSQFWYRSQKLHLSYNCKYYYSVKNCQCNVKYHSGMCSTNLSHGQKSQKWLIEFEKKIVEKMNLFVWTLQFFWII